MKTTKKVYDFDFDKVRLQVSAALRRHGNQGTVADVIGLSGVPKYQVERVLPALVADCRGQMAVTESGEVLYRFPQGFSMPERSWGKAVLRWTGKALATLFKAWILVMLVGYFVLFLIILLVSIAVSIALSASRRDDRESSGGGIFGFFLVTRVVEWFTLLWLYSGDPVERQAKKRKPFHRAVFEFVFGVEDRPDVREKMERKAFVSFIRENKGTISLEELMALTGRGRQESDALISRLMLEFEGEPRVSEAGTLNFFFPGLLFTSGQAERPYVLADQELIPFTRNPARTNNWIVFLNGFNIVFGVYFLAFGLQGVQAVQASGDNLSIVYLVSVALVKALGHLDLSAANGWVVGVLGWIPALYSGFFFGIPLVRRLRENGRNFLIQVKNLRRKLMRAILKRPTEVRLDEVQPTSALDAPGKPRDREALKEKLLQEAAGGRPVEVSGTGPYVYSIPDLEREKADLEVLRRNTDLSQLSIGKVIFDTQDKIE